MIQCANLHSEAGDKLKHSIYLQESVVRQEGLVWRKAVVWGSPGLEESKKLIWMQRIQTENRLSQLLCYFESCSQAQKLFLLSEYLCFTKLIYLFIYWLIYWLFIDKQIIVNSLFNDHEHDYDDFGWITGNYLLLFYGKFKLGTNQTDAQE